MFRDFHSHQDNTYTNTCDILIRNNNLIINPH